MPDPLVLLPASQLAELIEAAAERGAARALASRPVESDWLDSEGASRHLGIPVAMVQKRARRGEMPAHRIGPEWRFSRRELDAWVRGAAE